MRVAHNLFSNYRVIDNTAYVVVNNNTFVLDEVGQRIWQEIGSGNSVENIISVLQRHYKVEDIEEDIKSFIDELLKSNLIEVIA